MSPKTIPGKLFRCFCIAFLIAVVLPTIAVFIEIQVWQKTAVSRFEKAITGADRVVVRFGPSCPAGVEEPVLVAVTNVAEVADFGRRFRLRPSVRSSRLLNRLVVSMSILYPAVDWLREDERVASVVVEGYDRVWLKGFGGDAVLTDAARKDLDDWFAARGLDLPALYLKLNEELLDKAREKEQAARAAPAAGGD